MVLLFSFQNLLQRFTRTVSVFLISTSRYRYWGSHFHSSPCSIFCISPSIKTLGIFLPLIPWQWFQFIPINPLVETRLILSLEMWVLIVYSTSILLPNLKIYLLFASQDRVSSGDTIGNKPLGSSNSLLVLFSSSPSVSCIHPHRRCPISVRWPCCNPVSLRVLPSVNFPQEYFETPNYQDVGWPVSSLKDFERMWDNYYERWEREMVPSQF